MFRRMIRMSLPRGTDAVKLFGRPEGLLVTALIVGVVYYAGVWVGFATAFPGPGSARRHIFWPPNVILLAALLVTPARWWLPCSLSAFAAHLVAHAQLGVAPAVMALPVQFAGNVFQAMLAALALRRVSDPPWRVDTLRSMVAVIVVAGIAAPALVSALIIYVYVVVGWMLDYASAWRVRFLANAVSTITLAPLLLTVAGQGLRGLRDVAPRRAAEFLAVLAALLLVGTLVAQSARSAAQLPLLYTPIPLLLWAAMRFGPSGLSIALTATVLLFVGDTFEEGPSVTPVPADNIITLGFFLVAIAIPLLLLAAVVEERRRAEERVAESQERYRRAVGAGNVSVWDWDLETDRFYVDPVLKSALGYGEDDIPNTIEAWTAHMPAEDRARVRAAAQAHVDGATPHYEIEHRLLHRDGSVRWFHARGAVSARRGDKAVRMSGTDTDITERRRAEQTLRENETALRASYARIQDLAGRLITAQESERSRIARDLHDDINQQLAGLSIAFSNVKRRLQKRGDATLQDEINRMQQRTIELADVIRNLSHELHPGVLQHAGLVAALKGHCADFASQQGIEIALSTDDSVGGLPDAVALCLYRVAQEALRNIAAHSGARNARVTLRFTEDVLELIISDDGRGFNLAEVRGLRGLGLISLEERVRLIGGSLTINTEPQRGTEVRAQVALKGDR
jgi:PAS domain S-box-containing protein